jgi:hypothetical protein
MQTHPNATTPVPVTRAIHVTAIEVDPATGRYSRASSLVIESVIPAEDLQNTLAGIARGRAPTSARIICVAIGFGLIILIGALHKPVHVQSFVTPTPTVAFVGFAP